MGRTKVESSAPRWLSEDARYDVEPKLDELMALLSRTPSTLNSLLRGLPDSWVKSNEGEGTWSAFDITAHLVHCDRVDWVTRAKRILEEGERKPFERLVREAKHEGEGKSMQELLDVFANVRAESLSELRALDLREEDLGRRGLHPALGGVTLGQLLATWGAHDLNHIHQLSRVLAHRYREAVGPWEKYLGVLHCDGHGE